MFKLGKQPKKRVLGLKPLSTYLKYSELNIPDIVNNSHFVQSWPMLGNDTIGDCHDDKTEVLTDLGWYKWPDYTGGKLATFNPATEMMEFQEPIAIQRHWYTGEMYFSSHISLDFAVTPGHRFLNRNYNVKNRCYGERKFSEISKISYRTLIPSAPIGHAGAHLEKIKIGDRTWDGTDLICLIALIISDGWVGGTENNWNRLSFCCFNKERRNLIASFAHKLGIKEVPGRDGVWLMTDSALANWFRANGFISNAEKFRSIYKCIPTLVKVSSKEQIDEFLNFFGDKSHNKNPGNRQFYSSSYAMSSDLQELLLRVGIRSSISKREARVGGINSNNVLINSENPSFTVVENYNNREIGLLSGGKQSSLHSDYYSGEVFCATVPNSTLITRRNDKILISGNCTIAGLGHGAQLWTAMANDERVMTNQEAIEGYEKFGYVPGNSNTDKGANLADVINIWMNGGFQIGGVLDKISGFCLCNHLSEDEIKFTIANLGFVYIGMELPIAAQDLMNPADEWNFNSEDAYISPEEWQAGGLGGHCVILVNADDAGPTCVTWGALKKMNWEWFTAYVSEAYGLLSKDFVHTNVDWSQLETDMTELKEI